MARSMSGGPGRHAAMAAGGLLAGAGLQRGGSPGALLAAAGFGLVLAGLRLDEEQARPVSPRATAGAAWPADLRQSITIAKPRHEVFAFFRDHAALTQIAPQMARVQLAPDDNFGRWVLDTPQGPLHYEAQLTDYREDERVAWRTLTGTEVPGQGWVEFRDAPDTTGTDVHVYMRWWRPKGRFRRFAAWLSGREPHDQLRETLERARQMVETGWQPPLPRPGEAAADAPSGPQPAAEGWTEP